MKLVAQITLGIVGAVAILFFGSAIMFGTIDATTCIKQHGAQVCRDRLDKYGDVRRG